jgi:adenylate cyclase
MRIDDIQAAVQRRVVVANAIAAGVVLVYLLLVGPRYPGESFLSTALIAATSFAVLLALLVVIATRISRRLAERNTGWFREDREPTAEERDLALRAPFTFAVYPLPFWLAAAILTTVSPSIGSARDRIGVFVTIMLGGALSSALSYPLIEQGMREITVRAMAGAPPTATIGLTLRARLILAWVLGSGIPLLGIALTPLVRSHHAVAPLWVPVVLLAAAGIAAGVAITVGASTAIAEPMEALRESLERIQQGHLRTSLDVDAGGEIGMVQAGFNQMAAGLREREEIRDLFGRHVGEEVARAALKQGVSLGGEQRVVSVFFVDLIGSSALARETEPARVVALLNRFFAAVVHATDAEAGWINKFEGDAALAVFGAPNDEPDHAFRALRAARALRGELDQLGIEAGIGVSSGTVVAGNVGTEARYEYTVIGHPVNEAARITDESKRFPGRLLASASAVHAAGPEASNWKPAGTLELRGVGATDVYAYDDGA